MSTVAPANSGVPRVSLARPWLSRKMIFSASTVRGVLTAAIHNRTIAGRTIPTPTSLKHPFSCSSRRICFVSVQWRWKHLAKHFAGVRAMNVTPSALDRYVDVRRGEGASNATIRRELSVLRRGFSIAVRNGTLRSAPAFPRLKESLPRSGFLSDAEFRFIIDAHPQPWFRGLVTCARTYGWRKSELLNLKVRQVDLLSRTVTLQPGMTKNDEGRTAYMTANVFVLLSELTRGKRPNDHVFTRNGKPVRDLRGTWRKTCIKAKVGRWTCPECEDHPALDERSQCPECRVKWKSRERCWSGPLFHDWRRTAIRNMVRNGTPERVAMKISGHKTRSVFDRYNIVSTADLEAAAKLMDKRDAAIETATFPLRSPEIAPDTVQLLPRGKMN